MSNTEFINLSEIYLPTAGGSIDGDVEVGGALQVNDGSGAGTNYDVAREITDLKDAWDSVSQAKDYIVDQGISGIWEYRKYASGVAECWGGYRWNLTSTGNYWWGDITLPFTFYKTANSSSGLTTTCGGGAHFVDTLYIDKHYGESSVTSIRTAALNVISTGVVDVYYYVIGSWK